MISFATIVQNQNLDCRIVNLSISTCYPEIVVMFIKSHVSVIYLFLYSFKNEKKTMIDINGLNYLRLR